MFDGNLPQALFAFTFYYPLFMSYLWMAGALFYWYHYERKSSDPDQPPELSSHPKVSLVVPCFNEESQLHDTVGNLLAHNYPDFEVIAINDGSSDRTGEILDALAQDNPRLRVIHLAKNQGKAVALNTAAAMADSDYLICIDGDAILDRNAARWMLWHFLTSPRVAAVTGNPRIRTRSTLLGRIQVGEFSSIIGLIKRAQRTYGRLFTVSGVVSGFRKSALHQVGYWSRDMLTEDIDVSWKLQLNHWDVRFEPAALCWILMPETFMGLWRQRLRWAMGGAQAILKYAGMWKSWRKRRMWPVYIEYLTSMMWSYSMLVTIILWVAGKFLIVPQPFWVKTIIPQWTGVIIGTTCLIQIAVSLVLDRRYDKELFRNYYWTIWYPLAYWLLNMFTTVMALPLVLLRAKGKRARWQSPDRGVTV
jgi:poly-beta-1,6-N-acetyl-D-glucosamine synthase